MAHPKPLLPSETLAVDKKFLTRIRRVASDANFAAFRCILSGALALCGCRLLFLRSYELFEFYATNHLRNINS